MGNAHNGSLPAYGAEGEMNAQMNPRSFIKHRKVTSLVTEPSPLAGFSLGETLGGTGLILLGMIYVGQDMPGARGALDWTKKKLEQPKKTTQQLLTGIGIAGLAYRAYMN
tara:strand:- start:155 stop:484 length:330 start_codon:yes stop_codon:yes gene_type:complete